jgi:hypothetical protein
MILVGSACIVTGGWILTGTVRIITHATNATGVWSVVGSSSTSSSTSI